MSCQLVYLCLGSGSLEVTKFEICCLCLLCGLLLFYDKSGTGCDVDNVIQLINLCTQQFMSLNMSIEGPGLVSN